MKRQTVTASLTVTISDGDMLSSMVNRWYEQEILPNLCPASKPVMEVISVEDATPRWTVGQHAGFYWLVDGQQSTRIRAETESAIQMIADALNEREQP